MKMESNRSGFALPLAIMLIAFLTVGVAAAFSRVQVESRVDGDRQAQTESFGLAQSGLETFLTSRTTLGLTAMPPAASESIRVNMTGGYADVVLRRVRPKNGTTEAIYVVKSRGVRTAGSAAWTPRSEKIVSQYALFREASMSVLSGWTSLSGIQKNGGSGVLSGVDNCGLQPAVAGVAVPNVPGYTQNGGGPVPTGSPPILDMGTQTQANNSVSIDWDGIVNHGAIAPDITLPGGTWPSFTNPNYWPVIRVNGNFSLPTDGRGTLIITGDLTISGSLQWRGIVLVGGIVIANGDNNVLGATVSALNMKLGITVPVDAIGNGNKTYQYDSCNVASAVSRFSSLVKIDQTWSDSWANW
jgi:Tfp pilus assembly protein PilX